MTIWLELSFASLVVNAIASGAVLLRWAQIRHPRKMHEHARKRLTVILDTMFGEDRLEPGLSDEDMDSALATAFAQGSAYFTNEASNLYESGNMKGARFNVAKSRFCQHLYEWSRGARGKSVEATDAERRHAKRDGSRPAYLTGGEGIDSSRPLDGPSDPRA